MPPLHPSEGLETRINTGDLTKASLREAPSATSAPMANHLSDIKSDFLYEDDEYFELKPRVVDTVVTTRHEGDVDMALNLGAGTTKVEFPNTLHGILAWTVMVEGTKIVDEQKKPLLEIPGDEKGPSVSFPRNHQSPESRYLRGAYSALSGRVGRWPKSNEEAQHLIDAWSANQLLTSRWDIPGLAVATTVNLDLDKESEIVDRLRASGIDEFVQFTDGIHRLVMSYVPSSELATVTELRPTDKRIIDLSRLASVSAAGGA